MKTIKRARTSTPSARISPSPSGVDPDGVVVLLRGLMHLMTHGFRSCRIYSRLVLQVLNLPVLSPEHLLQPGAQSYGRLLTA